MATGQVAGRLDDLPSVADLLSRIEHDGARRGSPPLRACPCASGRSPDAGSRSCPGSHRRDRARSSASQRARQCRVERGCADRRDGRPRSRRPLRADPRRGAGLLRRRRYQGNAGASRADHYAQSRQLPHFQSGARVPGARGGGGAWLHHRLRDRHLWCGGCRDRGGQRLLLAARGGSRRDGRGRPA